METLLHTFSNEGGAGPSSQLIFDNAREYVRYDCIYTSADELERHFSDVASNGQWVYANYTLPGGAMESIHTA